ncbi:hypothetical protein LCGC14_2491320, partial [marine sediment metagenome]
LFSGIKGLFGGGGGGEQVLDVAATNFATTLGGGMTSAVASAAPGFMGTITGLIGTAANFIPVIGPLLAAFGGPLLKGLKALGGKVFGAIKQMFGGPSGAELAARDIKASVDALFDSILSTGQIAEATQAAQGGDNRWALNNIAVRDSYLAIGKSEDEAAAAGQRLADASKATPEIAQQTVDEITAVAERVQAAMALTGLSLSELRNKAISDAQEMGISVEAAFNKLATAVPEAVATAANSQCVAQTKASDCAVKGAKKGKKAIKSAAMEAAKAVRDSTTKQIEGYTMVSSAIADTATKAVAITMASAEEQKRIAVDLRDEKIKAQQDVLDSAITSSTGVTTAFETSTTDIAVAIADMTGLSEIKLQEMLDSAVTNSTEIAAAFGISTTDTGNRFAEMSDSMKVKLQEVLESVVGIGGGFRGVSEVARAALDELLDSTATTTTEMTTAFRVSSADIGLEFEGLSESINGKLQDVLDDAITSTTGITTAFEESTTEIAIGFEEV